MFCISYNGSLQHLQEPLFSTKLLVVNVDVLASFLGENRFGTPFAYKFTGRRE